MQFYGMRHPERPSGREASGVKSQIATAVARLRARSFGTKVPQDDAN